MKLAVVLFLSCTIAVVWSTSNDLSDCPTTQMENGLADKSCDLIGALHAQLDIDCREEAQGRTKCKCPPTHHCKVHSASSCAFYCKAGKENAPAPGDSGPRPQSSSEEED